MFFWTFTFDNLFQFISLLFLVQFTSKEKTKYLDKPVNNLLLGNVNYISYKQGYMLKISQKFFNDSNWKKLYARSQF